MEFYRDEISYGKIPQSKILDKILRRNFHFLNSKKSLQKQLKIAAQSQQDRRKILCGAGRREERKFYSENPCGKIAPPKARPKLTKRVPKNQEAAAAKSSRRNSARKFLPVKSLWMGWDLNLRQIFQAKFYAKICIKPAKFIVNFPERFSRLMKFPTRSPFLARSV